MPVHPALNCLSSSLPGYAMSFVRLDLRLVRQPEWLCLAASLGNCCITSGKLSATDKGTYNVNVYIYNDHQNDHNFRIHPCFSNFNYDSLEKIGRSFRDECIHCQAA